MLLLLLQCKRRPGLRLTELCAQQSAMRAACEKHTPLVNQAAMIDYLGFEATPGCMLGMLTQEALHHTKPNCNWDQNRQTDASTVAVHNALNLPISCSAHLPGRGRTVGDGTRLVHEHGVTNGTAQGGALPLQTRQAGIHDGAVMLGRHRD